MKRFILFILLLTVSFTICNSQQPCYNPTAITISNTTSSASDISWTAGGTETAWNIEYGPSGFSIGSGTTASVTTNSYNIVGLNSATSYDVYVRADCGGGSLSNWEGPYNFLTSFGSPNNVNCFTGNSTSFLTDDLDSTGYWSGDFGTNNGSWRVFNGPTSTPNTGPSGAHNGNSYFYFESSVGGLDTASIISPVVDLSNAVGNQAELSFYYHFYGSSDATLDISISSDLINFSNLATLSMYQTSETDPFVPVGIDLSVYVGQIVYLKFTYIRGSQGTSYEGDIAIDLVEVKACSQTSSCYYYGDTMNISVCGDSIEWNNNYYYTSGMYEDTVYNFATCDSVIYLDLTLSSLPVIDLGIDTLICDSTIITLDAGIGQSSYSWSTGETTQSITYMGIHQGNFGVTDEIITLSVVGNNGCSNSRDILVSTTNCDTSTSCYYTIDMQDSYGDGWNGASLSVLINGAQYPQNFTFNSGFSDLDGFPSYNGDVVEFYFNTGPWDSEISFVIYDPLGLPLGMYGPNPPVGLFLTDTSNSSCVDSIASCYYYGDTMNISVCGDSIEWNNNYYYTSGMYEDTVYNFATCDSVIYLDLTLSSLPVIDLGIDTLICDSTIITLDAGIGQSSYSWSTGETTQSITYMGIHQGNFGVTDEIITLSVVGNNGCSNSRDILVSTTNCDTSTSCYYTIDMQDSYGDGWNGASLSVLINGAQYPQNFTFNSGFSDLDGFPSYNGDVVEFYFNTGPWDSEISFVIYDPLGLPLGMYGPNPPVGLFLTDTSNSSCVDSIASCYYYGDTMNISVCGDSIEWNNNYYYTSGMYEDTVYNFATCDSVIYLDLTLSSLPVIDLGIDTLICDSTIITLDAGIGQSSYSWSTGETTQSITYMGIHQGNFGVTDEIITLSVVGNNGCSNSRDILVSTTNCDTSTSCYYTIDMQDSYGDGWNGASLSVLINGAQYPQNFTFNSGFSDLDGFPSYNGDVVEFYFNTGPWDSEISFVIYDPLGLPLGMYGPNPPVGLFLTDTSNSSCVDVVFSCPSPSNLSAHYVDSNTTNLSWNLGGNESSWDLEYGLSGQALGQGNLISQVNNNQYLLTGLSENTSYRYYVRSRCGSTTSQWIGPFTFVTSKLFGTWKLADIAGALQVGLNQGDASWWSSSLADATTRACIFDDSIYFDGLGGMTHYMDGSTWLEPWQGVSSEQCGNPVAPHSGGNYTYTYFNNQLTVNGLGAHLGLPKAYNGGELSSPNNAVSSITYDIDFSNDYDTMIVDIQSAGGGSGWWRFIYNRTNILPPVPICDSSVFTEYHMVCDSLIWIDGNTYSSSNNTASYTFTNSFGCDSVVMLDLTVNNPVSNNIFVTTCDTYNWNGNIYTNSGIYLDSLLTTNGCDSIVTLDLTINNSIYSVNSQTACDSYNWNGNIYDSTGFYIDTLQSLNGCDSIVTLDLTIKNSSSTLFTVISCHDYLWNGNLYSNSGFYFDTLQTINGCDSVVTLSLIIKDATVDTISVNSCDFYSWRGNTYNQSGIYHDTLQSILGCDSILLLDLTLTNSTFTNVSVTSCQNYLWNGNNYNLSGIYTDSLSSVDGCDSVVTLNLTVINSVHGDTLNVSACDEFLWQGNQYNQTGLFSDTLINNSGCDSIIYLNLTVNGSYEIDEYISACTSYNWNGNVYTTTGTYIDTLQTYIGCDSIVNLYLTIASTQLFSDTIVSCDYYLWNGLYLDSSGQYVDTLQTSAGCDSILTLDLIVYENAFANDSVSTCEFYDWNGVRYTLSGVYIDTFQTSNGCDSVVSLNLNLFPVYQDTIFASACDSFVWYGNTYTSSGIYTNIFSTINGCDSVEVLNFSLNNNNNTSPIDFELVLDDYCLETHWNIVNSDGIIVHQEGPYDCNINGSGPQSNQTINRTLSLEQQDCYTFTLYDDFGDGLGASQWGGTDGSWLLNDLNGNTLSQGQGDFGDSVSVSFYINEDFSTSIIESENNFSEIIAYPNPFIGETEIQFVNFEGIYDVSIRDVQGKIVYKLNNLSNNQFTLSSSSISRGVYWVILDNHPTIKPLKLVVQ